MFARFLELIWFMLPAYCANMAPPFVKSWRGWNRPIHSPAFGEHKTVVGFGLGVAVGITTAFLQSRFNSGVALMWNADAWFAIGLASGAGALGGDAIKSSFKRRLGIAPGASWIPADQLDFVIGALIPLVMLAPLNVADIAFVLAFTFIADIAVNHVSFYLGIRDSRW